jgi:putative membrane protein
MLWVKAFHLVFMVTWFAGLFYLPRLFVYHADTKDNISNERFKLMERRLMIMTNIGAALTLIFGLWLLMGWRTDLASAGWFHAKLGLVVLLLAYHHVCGRYARVFREDRNSKSARFYRLFNEVPSLLLISVIVLAIVKPF